MASDSARLHRPLRAHGDRPEGPVRGVDVAGDHGVRAGLGDGLEQSELCLHGRWIAIEHLGVRDREIPAANPGEAHLFERVDAAAARISWCSRSRASREPAMCSRTRASRGRVAGVRRRRDHVAASARQWSGLHDPARRVPARDGRHAAQFASIAQHDFPITRVDHLAILPSDFDASTQYWIDVLGVPMQDELTGPDVMARRFKVGDLVVALVRPVGNSSPLSTMPTGLLPMVAFEVADVEAAVALGREPGFTVSDPAPGSVEGTVVASIPSTELAGTAFSLVQYV